MVNFLFAWKVVGNWGWFGRRPEFFVHFGFKAGLDGETAFLMRIGQTMMSGSLFPLLLDVPRHLNS